jgi:hypothetical protein
MTHPPHAFLALFFRWRIPGRLAVAGFAGVRRIELVREYAEDKLFNPIVQTAGEKMNRLAIALRELPARAVEMPRNRPWLGVVRRTAHSQRQLGYPGRRPSGSSD